MKSEIAYVLRFMSTDEVCLRGGLYGNVEDAAKGRDIKNLAEICYIAETDLSPVAPTKFGTRPLVQECTNPNLILDPSKPAYIVRTL